jgi:hypothetical protein
MTTREEVDEVLVGLQLCYTSSDDVEGPRSRSSIDGRRQSSLLNVYRKGTRKEDRTDSNEVHGKGYNF